jgi:hypothetical protein
MRQDFIDKGVRCNFPDPLTADLQLTRLSYKIEPVGGQSMRASYRLHYVLNGEVGTAKLVSTIPTATYMQLQSLQASKRRLVRLICYYTILGLQTGQFWGLVPEFYKIVQRTYGDGAIECFASPFNHTLERFYSPLAALEKPFGSMGNFFYRFPRDTTYSAYIINPPFVEPIINKVFELVQQKLKSETRKIDVIIYLPNWRDLIDPCVKRLATAGTNTFVKTRILPKGNSMVYDYTKQAPFVARFETILIFCSNSGQIQADVMDRLYNSMRSTQHGHRTHRGR